MKNEPPRPIRAKGFEGFWNPGHCEEDLAHRLAACANRPPRGMILLKFGSRSVVGAYDLGNEDLVVLKYYRPSHFFRGLAYGLKGSRGMRSWNAGLAFHRFGIPTPAPLVIAEKHSAGGAFLKMSFLATRLGKGEPLTDFVSTHGIGHPLVAAAAKSLKTSFHLMEKRRCVHGDLKANNLIVSAEGEVSFVDLDSVSCNLSPGSFRKLREKDRERFLKNWQNDPRAAEMFRDCFGKP